MKGEVKSRVYVLYTGGTFGMAPSGNKPGAPLEPLELDELKKALPDAGEFVPGLEVTLERFERLLDSSAMTPRDWIDIARRIEKHYDDHDGFVIIHGTDTMAYTASALSFMLENLAKPVVLTGSQLPLGNRRTDALLNYGHSLMIAGYKASGLPLVPEVIIVFADRILRGCRSRKMSASAWTGFESPNYPALGEIGEHVRIFENQIRPAPPPGMDLQVLTDLDEAVLDVSLTPSLTPQQLEHILGMDNVKGVVLRTYGTGNAPDNEEFLSALARGIRKNDKVVVNVTQCPHGMVEMGLYAASTGLIDIGVLSGLDMTPEAALTKLMVTLGTRVGEQVRLQMQLNMRGEQSQNLFDFTFRHPEEPQEETWTDFVTLDRRFDPTAISNVTMRIKNVVVEAGENVDMKQAVLDVYMNQPQAKVETLKQQEHPRRILRIPLDGRGEAPFDVVESLSKEQVRSIIGDSDITLTFVASEGVRFRFDKLSLAIFTQV